MPRIHPRIAGRGLCGLISLLGILAAAAGPAQAQSSAHARVAAVVDSIAVAEIEGGRVAGFTVAAVLGKDTLLVGAYGAADLGTGLATPDDAIYQAASIAKQVTAAAILTLQDDGLLDVDHSLARYLPDFTPNPAITLRHLLNHTSGLRDYTTMAAFELTRSKAPPRDSIMDLVAAAEPLHPPGEATVYANTNFFLLARVIEAVSGHSYADFVRNRLFIPARMEATSHCDSRDTGSRRVRGHLETAGGLDPLPVMDLDWSVGAASLCSTARDLLSWNAALHGGRLLSDDAYAELVAPGVLSGGMRSRYAAGLMVDSIFDRAVFRHGASLPGFRGYLAYYPDERLSIAILANSSGPFSPTLAGQRIAEAVFQPSRYAQIRFRDVAAVYVGVYRGIGRSGEREMRLVADEEGRTSWLTEEGFSGPLYKLDDDLVGNGQNRIRFVREGARVVGAWLDEVGELIRLEREEGGF